MDVAVPSHTTESDVKELLDYARRKAGNRSISATLVGVEGKKSVTLKFQVNSLSGHPDAVNAIRDSFGKLMELEQERVTAGTCT